MLDLPITPIPEPLVTPRQAPAYKHINPSAIRALCKENGRRVSKEALDTLDIFINTKLVRACSVHNGGKKTLDAQVLAFVGVK